MKNPHLLAYCLSTPWALMPERMAAYAMVLASHYADAASAVQQAGQIEAAAPKAAGSRSGGIAIVPVSGAMVEWPSQIDICEGGCSSRQVSAALSDACNDETVGQILMVFNTPGGSVYGVAELADQINRCKAVKPVIGIAQSLAASAGYWALSQCTEAYVSPGGEVGSIGVYSGHEDISKALEMAGISIELFSAGKYKTEGHPFGPMSDEAKAYQLQRAQDYYGMFTKAVSKGRNVPIDAVRNGMGQGRVLGADAALAEKMVDGVMSMDDLIARMRRNAKGSARSALKAAKQDLEML